MAPRARLAALAAQNAVILLLLVIIRRRRAARRRQRQYVRSILQERPVAGEYRVLTPLQRIFDYQSHLTTFRMTPTKMQELLEKIGSRITHHQTHINPIDPGERLAVTLKFLATGIEQTQLATSFLMGRATVHCIINETCRAIWDCLHEEVLAVPQENEWRGIATRFESRWNFPHCIGAIDGKHIVIQAPHFSGSTFFNYKNQHSIVLLATCDDQYNFTLVDIGSPGSNSDGGIFAKSPIGKGLESNQLNIPPPSDLSDVNTRLPYIFVGDEAFPLKHYLMRPFPQRMIQASRSEGDLEKAIYNYRLCRARRLIENVFGIWSIRWRIFKRPIIGNTDNVIAYVKATICLHNWLRSADQHELQPDRQYNPQGLADTELEDGSVSDGEWRQMASGVASSALIDRVGQTGSNMYTKEASNIRMKFAQYFSSPEESVSWQLQHVLRGHLAEK